MIQLRSVKEVQEWRKNLNGKTLGFVPTMGALHEGHLSLIEQSQQDSDVTLVSIFVNPLQFNSSHDLKNYPRPMDQDLKLLETKNVTAVWTPTEQDLYPQGTIMKIEESDLSRILCGAHRPGHFSGMLTVVMKLLQVTKPNFAFFGEKDYQQLMLIQKMVAEFFLDVVIRPVPTLRAADGLALSSRNLLLSAQEREKAPRIYKVLKSAGSAKEAALELEQSGFKVDYVEDLNQRRFAAAWLGQVRLIDNVEI